MSFDDSENENEMDIDCTPPDLRSEAKLAMENLLPAKSKEKYMKNEKNAKLFSETVFLAYFKEIAKTKKPSTLWAIYSMLKCTVHINNSIDLKNYGNLTTFLKLQSSGFNSKKSKILTAENIKQFLLEAPDNIYLATKKANAIRMIYCGEHTLPREEIIAHFRASVNDVNSSYCEINISGLLVAYDSYFVHIIEGSEDTVHRQIRFLLKREKDYIEAQSKKDNDPCSPGRDSSEGLAAMEQDTEENEDKKMFRRMKMLIVYHSRKKLFFKTWRSVTARPPTLVSKLNIQASVAEHMEQLRICLDKIQKLIALAVEDDQRGAGFRSDYRSPRIKQLTFEGISAVDTRMDALPEVALLSFLLDSSHLMDLKYVSYLHRRVDDHAFYAERVWPVPTHYTPRHLYKLKVDDSFVEQLPVMPWELKQGDDEEKTDRSASESSY